MKLKLFRDQWDICECPIVSKVMYAKIMTLDDGLVLGVFTNAPSLISDLETFMALLKVTVNIV